MDENVVGNDPSLWSKESCPYDSNTDVIDLWRVDLSKPELDRQALLSNDEIQRADKFVLDHIRNTFVRSRCALRLVLSQYLNKHAAALEFSYGRQGKPELSTSGVSSPGISSPRVSDIHFNLSHSENLALIGVAKGRRVGVDLHNPSRISDWNPIAKRSFSSLELAGLLALPSVDQELAFHRIWTQKEAYTKAIGDGYAYGFQKFSVLVNTGGDSGLVNDEINPESVSQWNIQSINAGSGCVASLAYDGIQIAKIRQWEFCIDQD